MGKTEVAVVGAGPAGIHAAVAAAELGVEVTLIDSYAQAGGQYFKQLPGVFQAAKGDKRQREAQKLFKQLQHPDITHLPNTRVWNIAPDWRLDLVGSTAPRQLEAEAVVLATGAYDRPAAFPGWTLPGVMGVGAAQHLVKIQRVLPGRKILVAGSGPLLLALGAVLVWAGAEVVALAEGSRGLTSFKPGRMAKMWGQGARLREGLDYIRALRGANVPYRRGWGVVRALGEERVSGAVLARLDEEWRPVPGSEEAVSCDTLCIGYGLLPETTLGRLAGASHVYRPRLGGWVPERDDRMQSSLPGLYIAGDGAGIGGAAQSAVEGRIAGMAAGYQVAGDYFSDRNLKRWMATEQKRLTKEQGFQKLFGELFTPGPGLDMLADEETIICRCEGVRLPAVKDAVDMGAETLGAVKGLTRAGMGRCQGRICGALLAGQVARLSGKSVSEVGNFTPRPPVGPLDIEGLSSSEE
ncbi:MAG: NAD(P)/FAD-dependent oxidoreductase [Candidatus Promineifilaceae bacterium]|nr:NAD(P)/FAD-dependent oxidoreductase [Candidatus Promineifilaceae bacterium]